MQSTDTHTREGEKTVGDSTRYECRTQFTREEKGV